MFRADFDWDKLKNVIDQEPSSVEDIDAIGKKIMELLEAQKRSFAAASSARPSSEAAVTEQLGSMKVEEDKVAFAAQALNETAMNQAKQQSSQERRVIGVDTMGNRVL